MTASGLRLLCVSHYLFRQQHGSRALVHNRNGFGRDKRRCSIHDVREQRGHLKPGAGGNEARADVQDAAARMGD